jgi:hypothetical protein
VGIDQKAVQDAMGAVGVTEEQADAITAALQASGIYVTDAPAGTPVAIVGATALSVRTLDGRPGGAAFAVRVGTHGWLVWAEVPVKGGSSKAPVLERTTAVFVPMPEGADPDPFVT